LIKKYSNHTNFLHLNSIHSSMYIGMRFLHHVLRSFVFCFLFMMLIWSPTIVSQHLSKSDKRGWLTRWPPRSFANPVWHSARLNLHRLTIMPLCVHLL